MAFGTSATCSGGRRSLTGKVWRQISDEKSQLHSTHHALDLVKQESGDAIDKLCVVFLLIVVPHSSSQLLGSFDVRQDIQRNCRLQDSLERLDVTFAFQGVEAFPQERLRHSLGSNLAADQLGGDAYGHHEYRVDQFESKAHLDYRRC